MKNKKKAPLAEAGGREPLASAFVVKRSFVGMSPKDAMARFPPISPPLECFPLELIFLRLCCGQALLRGHEPQRPAWRVLFFLPLRSFIER